MTTGFIICGALGREVLEIIAKHGWDAEVAAVPAIDHAFPERIAPDVRSRILTMQQKYQRLIVVFGDCGTKGALDEVLTELDIPRIAGPHCYEMYGGETFKELMVEEPGTFFLTDFMVRTFRGLILKSMGLDRYPSLQEEYFRNYHKVVFLAQDSNPALVEKAQAIAVYLDLPLEVRRTGYGQLEDRLVAVMMQQG